MNEKSRQFSSHLSQRFLSLQLGLRCCLDILLFLSSLYGSCFTSSMALVILFYFVLFYLFYFIFYLAASGLSCGTWGILVAACRIFRCSMWGLSLRHVGALVVAHGLSCPAACGILVPRPGIEPVSPALEGRFLTTGPPGKSLPWLFKLQLHTIS